MPIKDLPDGQEQDLWLDLQDPKEKVGMSFILLVQSLPRYKLLQSKLMLSSGCHVI